MFCSNCGKEAADGGRFCAHCGSPLLGAGQGSPPPPPLPAAGPTEYCQIEQRRDENPFLGLTIYFYADALGTKGKYYAGESKRMKKFLYLGIDKEVERIHREFVNRLVSEGWLPQPDRGAEWWQVRLRK